MPALSFLNHAPSKYHPLLASAIHLPPAFCSSHGRRAKRKERSAWWGPMHSLSWKCSSRSVCDHQGGCCNCWLCHMPQCHGSPNPNPLRGLQSTAVINSKLIIVQLKYPIFYTAENCITSHQWVVLSYIQLSETDFQRNHQETVSLQTNWLSSDDDFSKLLNLNSIN